MKTYFKKERLESPGTPIPEKTRRAVWERSKGKCEYCGRKAVDPHHVLPRSRGGSNSKNNLIALCRACHSSVKITQEIGKNPKKYIGIYQW